MNRSGGGGSGGRLTEADILQHNIVQANAQQQQAKQDQRGGGVRSFPLGGDIGSRLMQERDNRQLLMASNAALQALGLGAVANQLRGSLDLQQLKQLEQCFAANSQPSAPGPAVNNKSLGIRSIITSDVRVSVSAAVIKAQGAGAEEDEHQPKGSVMVPCRARRMPLDHNFKTAYFVISDTIKHGEELVCSYPTCRDGGVKFRFCSWCPRVPVAKRNFRQRHDHTDEPEPEGGAEGVVAANEGGVPAQATVISDETENKAKKASKPSAILVAKPSYSSGSYQAPKAQQSERKQAQTPVTYSDNVTEEKRKCQWAALITERPDTTDDEAMSAWINRVLMVSSSPKASTQEIGASLLQNFSDRRVSDESGTTSAPTDFTDTTTNQSFSNDSSSYSRRGGGNMNNTSNEGSIASLGNTSHNTTEETDSASTEVGESGSSNDSSSDSPAGGRATESSDDSSSDTRMGGSSNDSSSDTDEEYNALDVGFNDDASVNSGGSTTKPKHKKKRFSSPA